MQLENSSHRHAERRWAWSNIRSGKVLLDHSMRSGDTTTQSAFFTSEGEFSKSTCKGQRSDINYHSECTISCTQSAQCNGQSMSLMVTQASKEFKAQSSNQTIQGTILFSPWRVWERGGSGYRNKRGLKCVLYCKCMCHLCGCLWLFHQVA